MFYMRFITVLTVILLLLSFSAAFFRPKLHPEFKVYDSSFVVDEKTETTEETVETPQKTTATKEKFLPTVSVTKTEKTAPSTYKREVSRNTSNKTVQTETKKVQTEKPTEKSVTTKKETTVVRPRTTEVQKTLSAEKEQIAWNVWRSRIQNQIMKDVKLPTVPQGTIFRFEFTVSESGRVSSVKTWSETPKYTPYAIEYMAPVIRGYQGKEILKFPEGTMRTSTRAIGAMKISRTTKYSNPGDYNDTETITREY